MAGLEPELAEQRVALDGGLLGHGAGELAPVELVVGAPAGDELVVAALLDDVDGASATVKVLSRENGHQWLLPRNPDYSPILGDEASIMGKVVTVLRAL